MGNDPRDIWLWYHSMWVKALTNHGLPQQELASKLASAYGAWAAWRDIDGKWYFHLPNGTIIG